MTSNLQRIVIASTAAILGAQIPGLITSPTPAVSQESCVYHWGDLNRAAERAGSYLNHRLNGYPVGADMPRDTADTAAIGSADSTQANQSSADSAYFVGGTN